MYTHSIQDVASSENKQRQVFAPYDIRQDWTPWGRFGSRFEQPKGSSSSSIRESSMAMNDKAQTEQSGLSIRWQPATVTSRSQIYPKSSFDQHRSQTSNTVFNIQPSKPQLLDFCIPKQSVESRSNHLRFSDSPVNDTTSPVYNIDFSTITPDTQMSISGLMGCIAPDFDQKILRRGYLIQATGVIEEHVQDWKKSSVNTKTQVYYALQFVI